MLREIIGIMACDQQYVISNNGELPWNCPEEIAFYRSMIKNQIVIMGYATYVQMPGRFLEEHTVVVFSKKHHNASNALVTFVSSLDEFYHLENLPPDRLCFMIGGAEIATLFLENKAIDHFYLSEIEGCYPGDVFFPIHLINRHPRALHLTGSFFKVYCYKNLKGQDD